MSVEKFENEKWKGKDQQIVFRHKIALKMIGSGRVLDIGCGDGLFLGMLKNNDSIGIDISEVGVKKCIKKGLKVSLCDFSKDKLPFTDNQFNYVVMLDVLEHLYSPEGLLKEAKRVSKKSMIISVPNFSSLPARVQTLFGGVPENNRPKKGHVYWFNLKILEEMLKNNDLKIVDIKMNSFWGLNFLIKIFPSIFALSFVIKLEKYRK